jgi:hypothetical protein
MYYLPLHVYRTTRQRFRPYFFRHKKRKRTPMRLIFSLLMMVLIAGLAVTSIIYAIARLIGQLVLNPGSAAWNRAVQQLRATTAEARGRLVPWDTEMLNLLSLNRQDVQKPGWFGGHHRGTFTTIYHEPVLTYAWLKQGRERLLLAATSRHEFIYRMKPTEVEIYANGQPLGTLAQNNLLAPKSSKLLAQVEYGPNESSYPVTIGRASAITIANPRRATSPNPRALTVLRELSEGEETVALALAVLQMVE